MLSAEEAAGLCRGLDAYGVRFWVIGGWGVDALLRRETRAHKDLDVLVLLDDLPALRRMLDADGFTQKLVWEESQWVDGAPTAFVAADARGRELDVHVVEAGPDGRLVQRYDSPWPLPDTITAHGVVAGLDVNCVSRQTQVAMHTGYPLPAGHVRDVELLHED